MIKSLVIAAIAVVSGYVAYGNHGQSRAEDFIIGYPRVIDGDTIVVGYNHIRLWGIDAPEISQLCGGRSGPYSCGSLARDSLQKLIGTNSVICTGKGTSYGRVVAICRLNSGSNKNADLASLMVSAGLALDWHTYSRGFYSIEESYARRRGLGIWQGSFMKPWEYRR